MTETTTFDATTVERRSFDDAPVADTFRRVAASAPFVYGLTNYIAANLSANVLLAAGAGPAIGAGVDWPSVFPAGAGGVWINTATVMSNDVDTVATVARTAHAAGTPWVLDPVANGAGATGYDAFVRSLLDHRPSIIRGNASELIALAGGDALGKGVETTADSADAVPHITDLASRTGAVVAVSGPVDYITDGRRVVAVGGGDARLTQVTGAGCSLGALNAAVAAVAGDPFDAAVAAHAAYARAAENAANRLGPRGGSGSFATALVDGLWELAN
ncbi:hydroxyethylthiazole kinase [Gordonia sp. ABSL11-1]|uniref:hydroxyethylthiazole kinase n=1 Tax=Gordonia sp. ABSL11-1 TaxID=3053924 RepID=UPI0025731463|nr:hydroxyethylthiazole kinase [Gordonia sp. ABSL11-1]MDL9948645.1 hydroxyethylthiazole kinase [Gordonia sp. ABSL11-1]